MHATPLPPFTPTLCVLTVLRYRAVAVCAICVYAGNITAPYTAFVNGDDFGVGLLHVTNATHLNWQWYRSSDKKLLDSITIVKEQRWQQFALEKQQPSLSENQMEELQVKVQAE